MRKSGTIMRMKLTGDLFMNFFKEIISNDLLIVSVLSWLISQICKVFTNMVVNKTFDIRRLLGDGGMPSAHSATVVSLAAMCGYVAGFDSVSFAIAFIFAIVVMRDALGVRRETGKQAKSIKELAEVLNAAISDKDEKIRTENLKLLVGHTPLQVIFGAILGVIVSILYIVIFL